MKQPISEKQRRFVAEYLKDLNASRAAKAAGYKHCGVQGCRLLKNAKVASAIAAGQKKVCDKLEITAERVLQELAKTAFSNMDDFMEIDGTNARLALAETTRDNRAAISELTQETISTGEDNPPIVRTKIKLYDRQRGLELLGRHLKLFTDRTEASGPNGAPIAVALSRGVDEVSTEELEKLLGRRLREEPS